MKRWVLSSDRKSGRSMARGGWKLGGWGLCIEGWRIDEGSEFQSWGMKCWKLRLESLGQRRGGRQSVTREEERVVRGWTVLMRSRRYEGWLFCRRE